MASNRRFGRAVSPASGCVAEQAGEQGLGIGGDGGQPGGKVGVCGNCASMAAIYPELGALTANPACNAVMFSSCARSRKRRSTRKMTVARDILRLPRVARPVRAVLFAVLVVLAAPYVIAPFYAFGQPVSTAMLWRRMNGERVVRTWVSLAYVDPDLARAVIVAEDGRFCSHSGLDFTQIQDAIQDADSLEEVRGGSTITQQVAKNLFLWQSRSWVRKALEAPLALWIDLVLSKRRILELYLNVAEWGPNGEFGVEAGAERAFGTPRTGSARPRRPCWRPCCPIRTTATPGGPGRACGAWRRLYVVRAARAGAATAAWALTAIPAAGRHATDG